jgi:hypothetical protein
MNSQGGLYYRIMGSYNNQLEGYTLKVHMNYSEKYRPEVYEWIQPLPITYANGSFSYSVTAAKSMLSKDVYITFPSALNELLNRYRSVVTKLGQVRIIGKSVDVPAGWRILTFEEGTTVKNELLPLLDTWSIVGFDYGKLDGSGYGYQLSTTAGPECGEQFILRK